MAVWSNAAPADDTGPDEALRDLRRATLGRSVRSNVEWLMRAIGWGSIVYLIAWTIILVITAVQSLQPLPATVADPLRHWLPAAGALVLALALHLAARAHVTPVWLDRRDLAHLANAAASPAAILRWPAWRAVLAPRGTALAWAAAVAALLGTQYGWTGVADWFGAPAAATVGALGAEASLAVGALAVAAVTAFALRTAATTTSTVPSVVLRQSLQLGELRAIATLRGIAAMTMTEVDPGAGFAASRLRDELRGRREASSPRWRPALPRRGGAASAFAWLGVVRAWRSSPWTVLAIIPACLAAVAAVPPGGPFGGASLAPSLALAWVAGQLHPGRVPWPGFAIDGRARTLAALLLVAAPVWVVATFAGVLRPLVGLPPVPEDWLVIPLALAAGAIVDILGGRAASTRAPGVWLTAAVLIAAPAAILGWSGLEPSSATPIVAAIWAGTAWLRLLAAPPVG